MKITSIRCDYCNIEVAYEDKTRKDNFRSYMTLSSLEGDKGRLLNMIYCSAECLMNGAKETVYGTPLPEDVLKAMAEKLGYTLNRILKPKANPESELGMVVPLPNEVIVNI